MSRGTSIFAPAGGRLLHAALTRCGCHFCRAIPPCSLDAGYTHAILVKLDASLDALKAYSEHPAHMKVVTELIAPIRDDVMAVDYIEGSW